MKKLNVSFEEGRRLLYDRMASESEFPKTEKAKRLSEERLLKLREYLIEDLRKEGREDLVQEVLKTKIYKY